MAAQSLASCLLEIVISDERQAAWLTHRGVSPQPLRRFARGLGCGQKENQMSNDLKHLRTVTVEEVNRILEIGKILSSVLNEQELKELERSLSDRTHSECMQVELAAIGNTGDS